MQERLKWISHHGEQILYADLRSMREGDLLSLLHQARNEFQQSLYSGKRHLLLLVNASGFRFPEETPEEVLDFSAFRGKLKIYIAIVGLTGIPKRLFNLILSDIELCSTVSEAQTWLVKQAAKSH